MISPLNFDVLAKAHKLGQTVRFKYSDKVRTGTVENNVTDRVLVLTTEGYRTFMLHKIQGFVKTV